MKQQFVKYKTYEGLNHTQCLVLSFVEMYGETYASNKHIGERLHISTRTLTRTFSELSEKGYIKIEKPKGRSRYIIFVEGENNIDNMTTQHRQFVQQHRQYVQDNIDKLSNNEKENEKIDEKAYNKEYIAMANEAINEWLEKRGI